MINSLLPIVALFFSSCMFIVSGKSRYQLKVASIIVSIVSSVSIFVFFVSLRDVDAGNDTFRYVVTFLNLSGFVEAWHAGKEIFGNTEYLFWPFFYILKLFSDEPRFFLISSSLISFFLSAVGLYMVSYSALGNGSVVRNERLTALWVTAFSLVLVFCIYQTVYFGNYIRSSISVPLALIAIYQYSEGKLKNYIVISLLAIGFHQLSYIVLLFPLYCMLYDRLLLSKRVIVVALFSLMFINGLFKSVVLYFIDFIDSEKAELYLEGGVETQVSSIFSMSSGWIVLLLSFYVLIVKGEYCKPISFFLFLVLIVSFIPIIAVRYFPFLIFISMPWVVVDLLRRFGIELAVGIIFVCFSIVAFVMFNSESVRYTLGLG